MPRNPGPSTAVALVLLLILVGPLTGVQGAGLPEQPPLPPPPDQTGIYPVDRIVGGQHDTISETYSGTVGHQYRLVANATEQALGPAPKQPILFYQDGAGDGPAGPDARFGGFGDWQTFGPALWGRSEGAANRGEAGFQSPMEADGTYPGGMYGLLLSPELDLRTGFVDGQAEAIRASYAALYSLLCPLEAPVPSYLCGVYVPSPQDPARLVNPHLESVPVRPDGRDVGPLPLSYGDAYEWPYGGAYGALIRNNLQTRGAQAHDLSAMLSFEARYNLGATSSGFRDLVGVRVYTAPPTAATPVQACQDHCQYVRQGDISGFGGFSDWSSHTIDLTAWMGQSIWVGFIFWSLPIPSPDYFHGPFFPQQPGFFGFHFDDVRLTAPGPPENIRVRPLREPSLTPHGQQWPTLHPDDTIPVDTEVVNMGLSPVHLIVRTQLLNHTDPTHVLAEHNSTPMTMASGAIIEVRSRFDPLPAGTQALARVSVERVAGSNPDDPLGRARGTAVDRGEADPRDDVAERRFGVARVVAVVPGALELEASTVRLGDDVQLRLPLTNRGNEPVNLTLEARVFDVADARNPSQVDDLLPIEQIHQHFDLEPGESALAQWEVRGDLPGQYRLFVRDLQDLEFDPLVDLQPAMLRPLAIPLLDKGLDKGLILDGELEPAWDDAYTATIETAAKDQWHNAFWPGPTATDSRATLRLFHDTEFLYASIVWPTCDPGLMVLFDDHGDQVALDEVDGGVRIHADGTTENLRFDATSVSYKRDPEPANDPLAAQRCDASTGRRTFELARRLPAEGSGGPQAAAGDLLGMFIRVQGPDGTDGNVPWDRIFPPGAEYRDGGIGIARTGFANPAIIPASYGLNPPDGSLSDEMDTWQRLSLSGPHNHADPRLPLRVLSPGFGVERSAPALFIETFDECPSGRGWVQQNIVATYKGGHNQTEKWSCGPFGPQGRNVLFEGLAQDESTTCTANPCPPHATLGWTHATRRPATIITPPIEVGATQHPWFILQHQTSNFVMICDARVVAPNPALGGYSCTTDRPNLRAHSVARVDLQVWDNETGAWGNPVLLVPDGGYSTEESLGIADPARNGPDGRILERCGTGVPSPENPKDTCGWWDPAGWVASYRPSNESIATGAGFTGSPWRVDRMPLFGNHGPAGNVPVDVQGKTIRLSLVYERPAAHAPNPVDPLPALDYGWRIGAMGVMEEPRFLRDVSVAGVQVVAGLFDPSIGVGPGTDLPVTVTVHNGGVLEARNVQVQVEGIDIASPGGETLCQSEAVRLDGLIAFGESQDVQLVCSIADRPGGVLSVRATAWTDEGDEFPRDNHFQLRDTYPVRAVRDAAVRVGASPEVASSAFVRTVVLTVENHGNVPLSDFDVWRTVVLRSGAGQGDIVGEHTRRWHVEGTLPIGGSLHIQAPALATDPVVVPAVDLLFRPPGPGTYDIIAQVRLPGDADPSNDIDRVTLSALGVVYAEDFDSPPTLDPAMVLGTRSTQGTPDIWSIATDGDRHGRRLLVGDHARTEIPLDANASLVLPPLDLTAMRSATLAFNHRYDLEHHFDAGRVEVSTDGGDTWRILHPNPQPQMGLPEGYPSMALMGSNALLGGMPEATAVAFTGRSEDLPGAAPDGYIPAEFNLANDPELREWLGLETFRPQAFAPQALPGPVPADGGRLVQFSHPTWAMPEPNNATNQRFWWIQNVTLEDPTPRSGSLMWWSGAAGEYSPQHPTVSVCTSVSRSLPLDDIDVRPDERIIFSWWDWRAGWQDDDGPLGERRGTGARYEVTLQEDDGPGVQLAPAIVERRSDGWTHREVDLTAYRDAPATIQFAYTSRVEQGFAASVTETNRGWFIDDVRLDSWIADATRGIRFNPEPVLHDDLEGLVLHPATGTAGQWSTRVTQSTCSSTTWQLVERGAAQRPGGWHVQSDVAVPGQGTVPVWRFAASNDQGYPHLADARLVTPVVDLSQLPGDSASLRFMHRFEFEALQKAPLGEASPPPPGGFTSARDGGVVEYQVFDETTGRFGPWQQLFRGFRDVPDRILLDALDDLVPDRLTDDTAWILPGQVPNLDKPASTGYNALLERGRIQSPQASTPTPTEPAGPGYSFEAFPGRARFAAPPGNTPWHEYPISYVFSGASQGPQGWQEEDWDVSPLIGQRVRFGFHAQSNPLYADVANEGPLHGWSLAGVAIEGAVFKGAPVLLRLRAATDQSINKGSWDVDDLLVVGETFVKNLRLSKESPDLVALPGQEVEVVGRISNLGMESRSGLAVAVQVLRADTKAPYEGFTILDPGAPGNAVPASAVTPRYAGAQVLGPYALVERGDSIPARIKVTLPPAEVELLVQVAVLEDHGQVGAPFYALPDNQVSGALEATWRLSGMVKQDLRLEPPKQDRDGLLVATPSTVAANQPVRLEATLRNEGTTIPEVTARWQLDEILQKGAGSPSQPETEEILVHQYTREIRYDPLQAGARLEAWDEAVPPRNGLYRASVTFFADGQAAAQASTEFLVGLDGTFYLVDFSQTPAGETGWSDASPAHNSDGGGSPDAIKWRAGDDRFIWGVTQIERLSGRTYCSAPAQCNGFNTDNVATPTTHYGLEGIAVGPIIDLSRVPEGKARITLNHGHGFAEGAGGIVEVMPLITGSPQPAFPCGNEGVWFRVDPVPADQYRGAARSIPGYYHPSNNINARYSVPHRINPLAPDQPIRAFGGPAVSLETVHFDLAQPVRSTCGASEVNVNVVNYTVQFRFHLGTQPGHIGPPGEASSPGVGGLGWQVESLRISSASLDMQPRERSIPTLDGASKRFSIELINTGEAEDVFHVEVDSLASSLPHPSWVVVAAEGVRLGPGQHAAVPFEVNVPPDPGLARGVYTAVLRATSARNPGISETARVDLVISPNPMPDLALHVNVGNAGAGLGLDAGTVAPVHVTVFNVGQAASRSVPVRVEARNLETGYHAIVGSFDLPTLCPVPHCGQAGSRSTRTLEWAVPEEVGNYELIAWADPDGLLVEEKRSNNAMILQVRSLPLQRPDVWVSSIELRGVGLDGYAEEGSLVRISANVTNLGTAAARNVEVRILAGSSELTARTIEVLLPGETRSVEAIRLVSAGELVVRAFAIASSELELRVDNNELSRILRVRSHDFSISLENPMLEIAPGESTTVLATLSNRGNAVARIVIDSGGTAPAGWGIGVHPNPVTIAPNGTAVALIVVRAPADAVAGQVAIDLVARHATNPGVRTNTTLSAMVSTREGVPELRFENQSSPPGDVRIRFRLDSRSNAPQQFNVSLVSPGWLGEPMQVDLPAGGFITDDLLVHIPPTTPAGPHPVVVAIHDSGGNQSTVGEATLVVEPRANVSAHWSRAAHDARDVLGPRKLVLDLHVTNTGNLPVSLRAVPRDLLPGHVAGPTPQTGPVPPGAASTLTLQMSMPVDAPEGTIGQVELWMTHGDDAVSELAAVLGIPEPDQYPNLVMGRVDVSPRGEVRPGAPLRIHVEIHNRGGMPTPGTNVSAYLNGALVEDIPLDPIESGATHRLELQWQASVAGEYLITIVADGQHEVLETSKDDNGGSVPVVVGKEGWLQEVPAPPAMSILAVVIGAVLLHRNRRGGRP